MSGVGEIVTLVVDGQALQGWQSVRVTRSAEAAAIAFALNATNPAWSAEAKLLRQGKLVQIYTSQDAEIGAFGGGDLLCTGYVDDYESEIGENGHRSVSLSGRSKAGDAIDCPPAKHKTGLVENKDLKGVAEAFDEWGIGFTSSVALKALAMVQLIPGQSMFKVLEREARHLGVLLTGQPDGSVDINRAGAERHSGALVEGFPPVKRWRLRFSIQNKFSEVIVRGQAALGVDEKAIRQEQRAKDKSVRRHRPRILFHEGSHSARELKRRADWERLRRSGSGVSAAPIVSTWRDESGQLWAPGRLVPVRVPSEDLDQDLAIATVNFIQEVGDGEGAGTHAELTLVDPATLGGKGGSGGSGDFDAGDGVGE